MTTIELEPDQICPSPTNPRKKFDGLEELAASYESHGQISPLVVRPWTGPAYQLVVGERRWRAGTIAREAIPDFKLHAIVRDLNDTEVVELQLIENGQRKDITPLEEADTFSSLLKDHGYDVTRISDKTGKSHATIRARLLLCKLSEKARGLLDAGRMTLEAATRLARIPDAKLQAEALKDLASGYEFKEGAQITGRHVTQLVESHFMLELAKAPFDTMDGELVAGVGACGPCPHRTGNQGELFSDIKGKDICTNPPCFQTKKEAGYERQASSARARGLKVLSPTEAKEVFGQHGGVMHNSPFVELEGGLGWDLQHKVKGASSETTWRKVLGKDAPEPVLGKDASGAAVLLVPRKDAIAVLKKTGRLEKPGKPKGDAKKTAEAKERAAIQERAVLAAVGDIVAGAEKANLDVGSAKATAFWRWVVTVLIGLAPYDAEGVMAKRRPKSTPDADNEEFDLEVLAASKKTAVELRALAVEILVAETAGFHLHDDVRGGKGNEDDPFHVACRLFGANWKELLAAAKKPPKVERDDGNRCGLVDGKKGGGCIHELGHDGLHSDGKHTWRDPKPKKGGISRG